MFQAADQMAWRSLEEAGSDGDVHRIHTEIRERILQAGIDRTVPRVDTKRKRARLEQGPDILLASSQPAGAWHAERALYPAPL